MSTKMKMIIEDITVSMFCFALRIVVSVHVFVLDLPVEIACPNSSSVSGGSMIVSLAALSSYGVW